MHEATTASAVTTRAMDNCLTLEPFRVGCSSKEDMITTLVLTACFLAASATTAALQPQDHQHHQALNERGKRFMGFDQEATTHHFILTRDGGRIEVTARDAADATSIAQIRQHLRHIAQVFSDGDFTTPALVHDRKVPGVEAMKRAAKDLTYTFEEIDRGAHVRIAGTTPSAVGAVHEFLRFQIKDHATGDPLTVK